MRKVYVVIQSVVRREATGTSKHGFIDPQLGSVHGEWAAKRTDCARQKKGAAWPALANLDLRLRRPKTATGCLAVSR